MTALVDVVNFNADASCLTSARWLAALEGGAASEMVRWLAAFVEYGRKVSLGLTGATIADLAAFNPEAIELVDASPQIFELVLRPFSHDIALLRSRAGFAKNAMLGRRVIEKYFRNVTPYFLPPEFMLTNDQVRVLREQGVEGVFINASRFKQSVAERIPSTPYRLRGVLGATLTSIPVEGTLTQAYLDSLHQFGATPWNAAVATADLHFGWRDGESWLFLPDGVAREARWLAGEAASIRRLFVREALAELVVSDPPADAWTSYPVHSFSSWVRELRMLGFLQKLRDLEGSVEAFSDEQLALWLQVINSDVLSAVEKDDPTFPIHVAGIEERLVLRRSERGLEGEDYLVMFEALGTTQVWTYMNRDLPHLRKLRARLACIAR